MAKVKHLEHTKRLHAQVLKAMRAVIREEESSSNVYGDDRLCDRIRARGVWTSRVVTRDVRVENNIPPAQERRAKHFEREWKARQTKGAK